MATTTVNGDTVTITGTPQAVSEAVRVAAANDGWIDGTVAAAPVRVRAQAITVVKA